MKNSIAILCLSFTALPSILQADVKLPSIFGDNMVLQAEKPVSIWGKADPQEKVTVSVVGQNVSAVADAFGKWKLKLDPMRAGGNPIRLTVAGKNTLTLENVLVGEVWVGSGQSNMQLPVANAINGKQEAAAAKSPTLRLFTVKSLGWPSVLDDVEGKWVECSPEAVERFSATLYFFGRDLQQQIKQPVGLISCCRGGTIIQSWTPWEVLSSDPQTKTQVELRVKQLDDPQWVAKKFAEETALYEAASEKAKAEGQQLRIPKPEWIGRDYRNRPAGLYNAMIHPLLGLQMRGVVWYQGEFNAGDPEQYSRLFPKMVQAWRAQWSVGEFPFFFVQLPGNGPVQTEPCDGSKRDAKWAQFREVQSRALAVLNTAMAITIDTERVGELHPRNKQPVGNRLARLAANKVYLQKEVDCDSPAFLSMSREGSSIRIKFSHAEGLTTKDGAAVLGFAIAGADRNFVWADAKVEGDTVLVSNSQVLAPESVRYGWANNPIVSLYNRAGIPAAPFRTDDWQ